MPRCAAALAVGVLVLGFGPERAAAQADSDGDDLDYARRGGYVTAMGLAAIDDFDLGTMGIGGREFNRREVSTGSGIDARGGYRINGIFAAEGQFVWLAGWNVDGVSSRLAIIRGYNFFANGKAYALRGRFQPYGLIGLGVMYMIDDVQGEGRARGLSDAENAGAGFRVGLGIDMFGYGSDQLGFTAETSYVAGLGVVEEYRFWQFSAGLLWRF